VKTVKPAPWIQTIPAYSAGKSKEEIARKYGTPHPIKLASNENPLGPSTKALEAIEATMHSGHIYPDPDARSLRDAAAGFFGCPPDHIIAGNGSDEIIDLICRAYIIPGNEVIVPSCTFSYYRIASLACGGEVVSIPMQGLRIDVEGIRHALSPRSKVIFVANPNNPTGTYLRKEEILSLIGFVPGNVLLVMDEAYAAYVRQNDFMSAVKLTETHSNLITVHTLSKSHGLAGLRVGFGIASRSIMDNLLRIKPPFNVNSLAQKAGEAALSDAPFLEKTLTATWGGLDILYAAFERLGLPYIPSQTNFVLVRIGNDAPRVYEDLLKRGIITRFIANIGLDEYIRVSVGLPEENNAFISALTEVL
jgi:histidinol-phosphate aminotransferase